MHRCGIFYGEAVREFKKTFIAVALRDNKGNQSRTARALGMHRNTLFRHVAELGIREAGIAAELPRRPQPHKMLHRTGLFRSPYSC